MYKEHKQAILRIGGATLLLVVAVYLTKSMDLLLWQQLLLFLVPYLLVGWDVLLEAAESVAAGAPFDECFLMSIATLGSLCLGFLPGAEPEFAEAVFVMLFFKVGELFEELAEGNSRKAIAQLMDIRPDSADVEREGQVVTVAPEAVAVGEIIVIKPGAKVPLDGVVVTGSSSLDTVALTGESMPRAVSEEDAVISGCINLTGLLRVKTTKTYSDSTLAKILELVENAGEHKSKSESFITKFARYYTPTVVIAALALAFLPPLFSGSFAGEFAKWLARALMFLVVSCPCALVISVPLTFFAGIGGASKQGILIKGANFIDTLAKASQVVFDKTGTLTKGVFTVTAVHPDHCDANHLLHVAAHVERYSTHPIAVSLRQAYPQEQDACQIEEVHEQAGLGICALINGQRVCVGNEKMMSAVGAKWLPCTHTGTIIHVAINNEYAGHIVIADVVKEDAARAIAALKALGVSRTVMLTGDREVVARAVAEQLGLDAYHAELLPADKVDEIEKLAASKQQGSALVFVGDGINDAPVLARADIGIAMGAMGSEAAIEAADIVLMDDKPSKLATAIKIAQRTIKIARQNIAFAIIIKLAVLALAAVGAGSMALAVFADVGVTVLAVLNAMRALQTD